MDWWTLLGKLAVLLFLAAMAEKHFDHPGWLAEQPPLRWTANVVIGAAMAITVVFVLSFTVIAWKVASYVVFCLGVLWMLIWGLMKAWKRLRPDEYKPDSNQGV